MVMFIHVSHRSRICTPSNQPSQSVRGCRFNSFARSIFLIALRAADPLVLAMTACVRNPIVTSKIRFICSFPSAVDVRSLRSDHSPRCTLCKSRSFAAPLRCCAAMASRGSADAESPPADSCRRSRKSWLGSWCLPSPSPFPTVQKSNLVGIH